MGSISQKRHLIHRGHWRSIGRHPCAGMERHLLPKSCRWVRGYLSHATIRWIRRGPTSEHRVGQPCVRSPWRAPTPVGIKSITHLFLLSSSHLTAKGCGHGTLVVPSYEYPFKGRHKFYQPNPLPIPLPLPLPIPQPLPIPLPHPKPPYG